MTDPINDLKGWPIKYSIICISELSKIYDGVRATTVSI